MSHKLPQQPLRVSLVQPDLVWHQPKLNRELLSKLMDPLVGCTDLVLLPEMFTSGFTEHPENLASDSETMPWLLQESRRLGAAVAGSLAVPVEEGFVNRLLFVTPDGHVHHYDKVHLFRMGDEHLRYRPGKSRDVIEFRGWRLLLTVCYDIRFPVFCRNQMDYDALICVANWPSARRHHWRSLLTARAIENQAYVLGVNRVGIDGRDLHYSGDSLAVDYNGQYIIDGPAEPWVMTASLDGPKLQSYRESFPAWKDRDGFSLHLSGC